MKDVIWKISRRSVVGVNSPVKSMLVSKKPLKRSSHSNNSYSNGISNISVRNSQKMGVKPTYSPSPFRNISVEYITPYVKLCLEDCSASIAAISLSVIPGMSRKVTSLSSLDAGRFEPDKHPMTKRATIAKVRIIAITFVQEIMLLSPLKDSDTELTRYYHILNKKETK